MWFNKCLVSAVKIYDLSDLSCLASHLLVTKILVSNWWSQLASLPGLFRGSISPSQTGHAGRPWLCCWCNGELGLGDLSGGTVLATAVALQHSQPTQHIPTRKFHEALQYENACGFDSKWFYQVHWHTLGTTGHSNKEHPSDVILSETDLNSTMVLCQWTWHHFATTANKNILRPRNPMTTAMHN